MAFLNDTVKNWLKSSIDFYLELLAKQNIKEEDAIVYTLLIKSKDQSLFLKSLYDLADVKTIDLEVTKNSYTKEKFKYYKKIRIHIEKLVKKFNNDFSIADGLLNLNFLEIAFLEMNYYPEQTKKLFQLNNTKYHQLVEVLKQKISKDLDDKKKKNEIFLKNSSSTSNLSEFGAENLTDQEFSYNPLVGNTQALRKATKILLGGNSLIILGEAGVGKTTLVSGLAYNIKKGNVPDILKNKNIIMLPISGILANTQYMGTLEKHINNIIDYAKNNKDTIFYIDEIHMLMGAGQTKDDNIDISNLLKPYISNKTLQIIGATTLEEFDKTIGCNPAFRRRFSTITLNEPTNEEVIKIAKQQIAIKSHEYEIDWNFDDSFLHTLVFLTSSKNRKYYETINNPNITLKIINSIFESALYYGRDYLTKQDVIESIQDDEVLSSTTKNELIAKLSNDKFYSTESPKSKILTFSLKNR